MTLTRIELKEVLKSLITTFQVSRKALKLFSTGGGLFGQISDPLESDTLAQYLGFERTPGEKKRRGESLGLNVFGFTSTWCSFLAVKIYDVYFALIFSPYLGSFGEV